MVYDFEGRVAVISGSCDGMGKAHAKMLASRGACVVVNGRYQDKTMVDETVREIIDDGGTAVADYHDMSVDGPKLVQTAIDTFGRLDICVCNVGISRYAAFGDGDQAAWWNIFNVTFRSTFDILWTAWPYLKKSGTGRVILVSSSGILGNPGMSDYGAAKGAVWGFGNSLAKEGGQCGIQVITIMPSGWTQLHEKLGHNAIIADTLREYMGPEHVASFATYLCYQGTSVHGEMFEVNGSHAGRCCFGVLPRVFVEDAEPESWEKHAVELKADAKEVTQYYETGAHFSEQLALADPSQAHYFQSMGNAMAPPNMSK